MTVKDLIAKLQTFNPDAPVRVFQDVGGAFDVQQVWFFRSAKRVIRSTRSTPSTSSLTVVTPS